jgi:hypothetical protein
MANMAIQIGHRYGVGGYGLVDADGIRLEDAMREAGATSAGYLELDSGREVTRWSLPDGSVITVREDADTWDFGYPNCFCWQSDGCDCDERRTR